jgi:splicing factor 3B subunit 3
VSRESTENTVVLHLVSVDVSFQVMLDFWMAPLIDMIVLQIIMYGTISGGLGVLVPFNNSLDLDLFSQLEMYMRQLAPSLIGRDHLAFRSSFFPVKDVVDGDLCEQYAALTSDKQRTIAEETDRTPGELLKKLEDMRNKVL